MGDDLDRERPAKRIKLELSPQHQHHYQHQHQHSQPPMHHGQPIFAPPVSMSAPMSSMAGMGPYAVGLWAAPIGNPTPGFDAPWPPPSQLLVAFEPTPEDAHVAWAPVAAPVTGPSPALVAAASSSAASSAASSTPADSTPTATTKIETVIAPSISPVPPPAEFDHPPANHIDPLDPSPPLSQRSHLPRVLPATSAEPVPDTPSKSQDQHRRKVPSKTLFVSPFRDCIGSFGKLTSPRFPRPSDGNVNGYIKFHWPERKTPADRLSTSFVRECDDEEEDNDEPESSQSFTARRSSTALALARHASPDSPASTMNFRSPIASDFALSFMSNTPPSTQSSPTLTFSSTGATELVTVGHSTAGGPRMVPPQFGLGTKMDHMDRQFWSFYILNWCPGRSVLGKTNLWLKDFAKMHESPGVCAAIQSLAGIYIYDYQPMDTIRRRTNSRFSLAEGRLSDLLDKWDSLDGEEASELITIASILSMQDIVLTERRLQRPYNPRWLQGFRQSEHFLEATDQGSRFWLKTNVQLSSLRISQSIIVGRAVILAQPMMPLPSPKTFDPEQQAARFGWLLYGTPQDMYEIHGGCGFSKKLLHVMSQITYCAARLQQDRESPIIPLTAEYLLDELLEMRQWSSESRDWEEAKSGLQTIEWVRAVPEGYLIDSSPAMTDVTAEAWRIAAIIYLQCRTLRLPRNHPHVLANMNDLAKCIHIMPTSGTYFTAQAPLFPVFLLGMLATVPNHMNVSKRWFEKVVSTPVRSSVPPLYEALQRIWTWINSEPDLAPPINCDNLEIGKRRPWWERLVLRVQVREHEVLCLT